MTGDPRAEGEPAPADTGSSARGPKAVLAAIDRFQLRHRPTAFAYAVIKKFGEDRAGDSAALVAYYGFFSIFPLLLVMVTILGMALQGNVALQQRVTDSALANFPVIGDQISRNLHALSGSGLTLAIGLLLTLWSGLGVVKALQNGMEAVWNVPYRRRPNLVASTVRAVLMLGVLGVITLASAAAGGVGAASGIGWAIGGIALSLLLNAGLFLLAFRILTTEDVSWADVFPGAAVGAVAWTALQAAGGYVVQHQIQGASSTYGTFAIVIGLLAWLYLGAQVTFVAAEVNVVRKRRLWPRTLRQPPFTSADVEALTTYAKQEERTDAEVVDVRVEDTRSHPDTARSDRPMPS
jgi:YihY family inner membrane protein